MESMLICAPWDSHDEAMARAREVVAVTSGAGSSGAAVEAEGPLTWDMPGGRKVVLVLVRSPEAAEGLGYLEFIGPALLDKDRSDVESS